MEFLASLAIKALIGTSICGAVTVGTIYKCDKTLLGFAPLTTNTGGQGGDSKQSEVTAEGEQTESEKKDNTLVGGAADATSTGVGEKPTTDIRDTTESLETPQDQGVEVAKNGAKEGDDSSDSLPSLVGGKDAENVVITTDSNEKKELTPSGDSVDVTDPVITAGGDTGSDDNSSEPGKVEGAVTEPTTSGGVASVATTQV